MFIEMYGIGCAFCGREIHLWVGDRMWPCACPAPALADREDEPASARRRARPRRPPHPVPSERVVPRTVPA